MGHRVYRERYEYFIEIYNELTVLTICQLLILTSGRFVDDDKTQNNIGWLIIAITILSFVVNLLPPIYASLKGCITRSRLRRIRKKNIQQHLFVKYQVQEYTDYE